MTSGTDRPTILLVEPKRQALGVMVRRLNEDGLKVVPTDNATDAIALLHRQRFDLVLCELRLTGRTGGTEIARLMRDDIALADIPVMLITGKSDRKGAVAAYEVGADDVIAKPFDTDVLVARIYRRIARARALGELKADNAALDARFIARSIELGEMRDKLIRLQARR